MRSRTSFVALILMLILMLVAGCEPKCKPGTLLLTVNLTGAATSADSLQIDVAVAGGGSSSSTLSSVRASGMVEIDFSHYPTTAVTVTVSARSGSSVIAQQSFSHTLMQGCDVASVTLTGGQSTPDASVASDGFTPAADLSTSDAASSGPPTTLSLLAGGLGGLGSLDAVGQSARFAGPSGIAGDGNGNLYVADSYTVRLVNASTGAVTTLAGTRDLRGTSDGTGAAARFYGNTGGVAIDQGNLYVVDPGNHAIRRLVLATGAVTTFVSHLSEPIGIVNDGQGHLFVTDNTDHTVSQIDIATATVTTLAGSVGSEGSTDGTGSNALFAHPAGIVSDGQGNLFVADSGNSVLRQIVVATGAVTTLSPSFGGPQGLAIDAAGTLYVSCEDGTVQQLPKGGSASTLAGVSGTLGSSDGTGPAALFSWPIALAVEAGILYVTDVREGTVRRIVVASGAVTTLAGRAPQADNVDDTAAAARFSGPEAVVYDGAGSLYVADTANHTIRKVDATSGVVSTLAGKPGVPGSADGTGSDARFDFPSGVALDAAGSLFVTDNGNDLVRRIDLTSGQVSAFVGSSGVDGFSDGAGAAANFNSPLGIAADGAGNLYVADELNSDIRKIVIASATVVTLAGQAKNSGWSDGVGTAVRFNAPRGVAVDGAGNLWIADTGNHAVRKLVLSSSTVTTVAGSWLTAGSADGANALFDQPVGIVADGAGGLLVTDLGNCELRRVDGTSGVTTTVLGTVASRGVLLGALPAALNAPYGFALLADGEMVIADANENALLRFHR